VRIAILVGARPNFMKVGPVIRAGVSSGHDMILIHSGQHYDHTMSDSFFQELDLPSPDHHLNVGSGTHAETTGRVMIGLEPILIQLDPDWLVVVGDIDSTMAGALTASKLRPKQRLRIAHLEAGLRSRNWDMPEEINRVVADRLSDLLLTPSIGAGVNLEAEGIEAERVVFVGNVMIDTLLHRLALARAARAGLGVDSQHGGLRGYVLATLHRPATVDDPQILRDALEGLAMVSREYLPVVLPLHPRTRARIAEFGLQESLTPLDVTDPKGYLEMLGATDAAGLVVTDSGGLQEETTALGVPCVTVRPETERPVTVTHGTNALAPWPPDSQSLLDACVAAKDRDRRPPGSGLSVDEIARLAPDGWDASVGDRVIRALEGASL
jgi:UDP-N-acetylglucosamine 2-epimerase (non-hydrolysing)